MKSVEYSDIDILLCMMNQGKEKREIEQEDFKKFHGIGDNICFLIPAGFVEASDEYIRARYYSQNRPKRILKEKCGESNLMFQLVEKEPNDISMAMMLARRAIRGNDCTVTVYEEKTLVKSNYVCVWMDYKNFAGSECIYNLLFIIDIGEKRVFGAFNCLFEKYDLWKPIVLKILDSVMVEEKDNERISD